jgi:hypothetical protein
MTHRCPSLAYLFFASEEEAYSDGVEEDEAFYERQQQGRKKSLRISSADMTFAHGQSGYVYRRLHGRGQAATVDPEAEAFCSNKVMFDNICIPSARDFHRQISFIRIAAK